MASIVFVHASVPQAVAVLRLHFTTCDISLSAGTKLVLIQRSCGYALRPTLGIEEIARVVDTVRQHGPSGCIVAVDNCYGELTDVLEPCAVSSSPLLPQSPALAVCHCLLSKSEPDFSSSTSCRAWFSSDGLQSFSLEPAFCSSSTIESKASCSFMDRRVEC